MVKLICQTFVHQPALHADLSLAKHSLFMVYNFFSSDCLIGEALTVTVQEKCCELLTLEPCPLLHMKILIKVVLNQLRAATQS